MSSARRRSEPLPVKFWSSAGLLLTCWCDAACSSCYLKCGPARQERMPNDLALDIWAGLIAASPHGCRVHLTGGEPFGDFDSLLDLCRQGRRRGLGPLEKIETNGGWAIDEREIRRRLTALDEAGMGKVSISADPFHQQFVPIERPRLLARVAEEVLGSSRVQVRWRHWLERGFDTSDLPPERRGRLFQAWARGGWDRLSGRAAEQLGAGLQRKHLQEIADKTCSHSLLRCKHVHVGPDGTVMPGVCAGIALGSAAAEPIEAIWRRLAEDWPRRPVIGTLASQGPAGLARMAASVGFVPHDGYAGSCQLCWDVRRFLHDKAGFEEDLSPAWLYETA